MCLCHNFLHNDPGSHRISLYSVYTVQIYCLNIYNSAFNGLFSESCIYFIFLWDLAQSSSFISWAQKKFRRNFPKCFSTNSIGMFMFSSQQRSPHGSSPMEPTVASKANVWVSSCGCDQKYLLHHSNLNKWYLPCQLYYFHEINLRDYLTWTPVFLAWINT